MAKKKIAVLTGAGVSAESGLSTFRGSGGLWGEYDPQEVASIEGWYRNSKLVLGFYNQLRKQLSKVKPNAAHFAIAELEKIGFRYISGKNHHKIDWAGIRFPLAKTPSDYRACLNSSAEIINRVF